MSAKSATLAKSLHTVSVLVNLAAELLRQNIAHSQPEAIQIALDVLGYTGAADPYDLAAKAAALLGKQS
jgi:hypothetical protein